MEDKGKDTDVIADKEMQGEVKLADYGVFREHDLLQDELFVLVTMMDGHFIQPIYLFIKFVAPGRRCDRHDMEYLFLIEDCIWEEKIPHM